MNTVKAPMPGLVLNIVVEPGQTVEKGDPMIILEAMKMENVIKAAGEGRVKAIKVQKGMAVDKGQLLIELD
jgi:biotin carboxyl carrier protein